MLSYRLLVSLAVLPVLVRLGWRLIIGRERPADLAERLGRAPEPGGEGPLLWLHGASNGELASVRALLAEALRRRPELRVLVTANTPTGRALAAGWGLPRLAAALAPLDHQLAVARFLRRARPAVLVTLESEIWPNRLLAARAAGVPVLWFGARMSARSAQAWARTPGLARRLTGAIGFLSAQDAESEARFAALGLDPARIGPRVNLKALGEAAPHPEAAALTPSFERPRTLLLASTHEGEEGPLLAAFASARAADPRLRLILAPRHPRRAGEVAALLRAEGLAFATRSAGEVPGPDTPAWLADTMGEMGLWYDLAGITFVGGSLVDRGGHTPFEPARHGSAILHGPHVANFAEAYAALAAAGAALRLASAADLPAALAELARPGRREALAEAAAATLRGLAGDPGALLAALDRALPPMSAKEDPDAGHP